MSHTPEDLYVDYLLEQPIVEEEWREQQREIVESFTQDRLKPYFVEHPDVVRKLLGALARAKRLAITQPTAALVFAGVAIEVGYKTCLLRPVVSSLVHNQAMADMVMELATSHAGLDRFSAILQAILTEFAGVDLKTYIRDGRTQNLWAEMKSVTDERNAVVHRGDEAKAPDAKTAIAVAETLLKELLPIVLQKIGLRVESGLITEG